MDIPTIAGMERDCWDEVGLLEFCELGCVTGGGGSGCVTGGDGDKVADDEEAEEADEIGEGFETDDED